MKRAQNEHLLKTVKCIVKQINLMMITCKALMKRNTSNGIRETAQRHDIKTLFSLLVQGALSFVIRWKTNLQLTVTMHSLIQLQLENVT